MHSIAIPWNGNFGYPICCTGHVAYREILPHSFFMYLARTRTQWNATAFYTLIAVLLIFCYLLAPYPQLAMWFGFGVAGYSAIANDSIQTLGTFISSNSKMKWWILWLFIGGVMVITHLSGWFASGDIAFGRLAKIPQPVAYSFLSLVGPVILLIVTRLRMPVSTTFLILSVFSTGAVIKSMLVKTFAGYIVAFISAIVVWTVLAWLYHKHEFPSDHYNKRFWKFLQFCSTTFLWGTWLMQDTANVAVFLPRILNPMEVTMALTYLFIVIGILMYIKGGRIQTVVTEKTDIMDVRAATIIDFVYALVLLVFKQWNNIPMSTTWVFLGLLAGREIALTLFTQESQRYRATAKLVFKDINRAGLGLLISLLIVLFIT